MTPRTQNHPGDRILLGIAAVSFLAATAIGQTVTRGPYLQSGTENAVTVRWRTSSATDSRVRFGPQPGQLTSLVDNATVTTEHTVRLSGLSPSTRYTYAVGTTAATLVGDDANHFFVTAPPRGASAPMRIWVLGDCGTGGSSQRAVRDSYYAFTGSRHTDLVLLLGDNAYSDGTDSEYQSNFFNVYPTMLRKSVVWSTLGNHDGHSASSSSQSGPYYDIFTFPKNGEAGGVPTGTEAYYSFDQGNVHFVCLDSYETDRSPGGAMLQWLTQDLAQNTNTWLVAFFHHPPYSKGSHNSDSESGMVQMRTNALPILEAGGVDLVLCGHSHSYERSFLIDHHYGSSSTFSASSHVVDGGDGRIDGDGSYNKGGGGNEGAVYMVAGSSGQVSGGSLNHPAMFRSLNVLGSVVLDVNGTQMDVKFLDNAGAWQTRDYLTLTKGAGAPPVSDFVGTPTSGPAPLSVSFTDLSANLPSSWSWDFGDSQSSTQRHPSHTYANAGSYTVRLTATNSLGSDQMVKNAYITVSVPSGAPPVSNFVGTPTSGPAPLSVSFTDQSTNLPTSWSWTFGDGQTSTQRHPSHTYANAGSYTVRLTATNSLGSNQMVKNAYIAVSAPGGGGGGGAPPVSNFVGTPTSGPAPLSVSFTDLSTNLPTSWSWTFGDGQTSTQRHPSHTYANAGSYNVRLTATNSLGSNQMVKNGYITVAAPGGGGGGGALGGALGGGDSGGGAVDPLSALLVLGVVALAVVWRRRGSRPPMGARAQ